MRTKQITLAGTAIECSLSWKVMKAITEQVADPVLIAQEVQRQVQADEQGRDYTPKVNLDTDACVRMVSIASGKDEDEIGELFMEHGVLDAQAQAGVFIASLLGAEVGEKSPGKT